MKLIKIALAGSILLLMLGISSAPVLASQIFVCQSCTTPPGGDPNIISNTGSFNVGAAGNFTLQDPLLVIVGVYNGSGTPAIAGSSLAAVNTYGLTANQTSFTCLNAGCTNTAFNAVGLAAGGSESFVNWSDADFANGFAKPSSFELYVFAVSGNLSSSGSPFTIDLTGAPNGSFIIAYGCHNGTGFNGVGSAGGCGGLDKKGTFKQNSGDVEQTVFTNTGLVNGQVPEPGSLLLLGTGLLGLGGVIRRKFGV